MSVKPYDLIGDVHGQAGKLIGLVDVPGYREKQGALRHPERTAIFVGDLIDRGPNPITTVEIARRIVDTGTARCILGNHVFNAIAWARPEPETSNAYLRRNWA
jgi:hypothetical protein